MSKEVRKFRKEFLKTMIQLATAGFGLVAALAWNSAIQAIIAKVFPGDKSSIASQIFYAAIITFVAVFVTYTLGKAVQEESEEEAKK